MTQMPQDDDPAELVRLLHRFGLERDRLRTALAREMDLARADLDALEHLEADGPLSQRELGDRLLLTSGAVTLLVDRLETKGLISRHPNPDDRRSILLELGPGAEREAPRALSEYHRALTRAARGFSARERQALAGFLASVSTTAAAAVDALCARDQQTGRGPSRPE